MDPKTTDVPPTRMGLPGEARHKKVPMTALDPLYACASVTAFAGYTKQGEWYLATYAVPLAGAKTDNADVLEARRALREATGKRHVDAKTEVLEILRKLLGEQPGVKLLPLVWYTVQVVYGTVLLNAAGCQVFEDLAADGLFECFDVALVPDSAWFTGASLLKLATGTVPIPKCEEKILYGVVDYGCPMAHRGLRTTQGKTRVLQFWDQEGQFQIPGSGAPELLPGVPWLSFGSAASADKIQSYFGVGAPADDWALYQTAGLQGLVRDASHGAHLLGCLFSDHASSTLLWSGVRDRVPTPPGPRQPPDNPNPPATPDMVFVQLPSVYLQGVSSTMLNVYRLIALAYILECAGPPNTTDVVIPIASERYDGSHDGQSWYDQSVNALVEYAKSKRNITLTLLVSAGNCLRTNTHQLVDLTNTTSDRFTLRLPPGNQRETYVELWMPSSLDTLEVALQAPGATGPLPYWKGYDVWPVVVQGQQVGEACGLQQPTQPAGFQRVVAILLNRTDGEGTNGIAGDWQILVRVPAGVTPVPKGVVFGFIARTTPGLGGRRRGYQSTFLRKFSKDWDFENKRWADQGQKRPYDKYSISGLATTGKITVVGGYQARTRKRALYSAGGPAREPGKPTTFLVDAAAPSDESRNFPGVLGWGNRSAGVVRLSGTSVAAPLAARVRGRLVGLLPLSPGVGREDPQLDIKDVLP
jgi:hypothetical protein